MTKNYNYYLVNADISRFVKKQAGVNFRAVLRKGVMIGGAALIFSALVLAVEKQQADISVLRERVSRLEADIPNDPRG